MTSPIWSAAMGGPTGTYSQAMLIVVTVGLDTAGASFILLANCVSPLTMLSVLVVCCNRYTEVDVVRAETEEDQPPTSTPTAAAAATASATDAMVQLRFQNHKDEAQWLRFPGTCCARRSVVDSLADASGTGTGKCKGTGTGTGTASATASGGVGPLDPARRTFFELQLLTTGKIAVGWSVLGEREMVVLDLASNAIQVVQLPLSGSSLAPTGNSTGGSVQRTPGDILGCSAWVEPGKFLFQFTVNGEPVLSSPAGALVKIADGCFAYESGDVSAASGLPTPVVQLHPRQSARANIGQTPFQVSLGSHIQIILRCDAWHFY
jgi:hypothetical protein